MSPHPGHRRVPIGRVARHITTLHDAGMTTTWIAVAANVHPSTVYDAAHRRRTHMNITSATRILNVKPDPDGRPTIDATGAVRRMRALIHEGRTQAWIAQQLCWPEAAVYRLLAGKRTRITRDSHQLIDDLYRAAEDMPAVHPRYTTRSRRRAAKAGWHGRDAWWDDTIDDPAIGPYYAGDPNATVVDDVLVQRAVAGDPDAVAALNKAERVEATRRLLHRVTPGAVARRLNVSGATAIRLVAQAREEVAA